MKKKARAIALAGCALALISGFLTGAYTPFSNRASKSSTGIASQSREDNHSYALEDKNHDDKSYLSEKNEKWISYYAEEGREPPTDIDRDSADNGNIKTRRETLMWHLVEVTKNGNDPAGLELCLRWYAQPEKNDGT